VSSELKGQVLSGVLWNSLARLGQQALQFGFSVLLARLLLPEDFGTVSMILVFTGFVGMFADVGFSSALVQKRELDLRQIQSVFWFNIAIGVALSLLTLLAAPWLARFYRNPDLESVTRVWSVTFVLVTLGLAPAALMQRRMQFRRLAWISMVATVLSGAVGVLLALLGWGVWSLVAQNLISNSIITVLNWAVSGLRPQLTFTIEALRELWSYTVHLFGFNFVNYWARNADSLLIGRIFGAVALGIYNRAYGLMLLPITQIISVIASVMFPALSSIQHDTKRVKRGYLKAMVLISFASFPIMIGLLATARPFILTLYGEKWADVIPILRILCIAGLVQALLNPTGWLYTSQGRTDWLFRWGVAGGGVLVMSILAGVLLGSVEAVAACYAVANLLLLYPGIAIPGRLIDMRFGDVVRSVAGPAIASAIMGLIVAGLGAALPGGWPDWQRLLILVASGVLAYAALIFGFRMSAGSEALSVFRELMLRRKEEGSAVEPVL
jgi:PST family polysaccharide transporter